MSERSRRTQVLPALPRGKCAVSVFPPSRWDELVIASWRETLKNGGNRGGIMLSAAAKPPSISYKHFGTSLKGTADGCSPPYLSCCVFLGRLRKGSRENKQQRPLSHVRLGVGGSRCVCVCVCSHGLLGIQSLTPSTRFSNKSERKRSIFFFGDKT